MGPLFTSLSRGLIGPILHWLRMLMRKCEQEKDKRKWGRKFLFEPGLLVLKYFLLDQFFLGAHTFMGTHSFSCSFNVGILWLKIVSMQKK
jgi:hypothetical protein